MFMTPPHGCGDLYTEVAQVWITWVARDEIMVHHVKQAARKSAPYPSFPKYVLFSFTVVIRESEVQMAVTLSQW